MEKGKHKECYGTMFPDALNYREDEPNSGKVFTFELKTAGGLYRSGRKFSANVEEWDDCLECGEFKHCYKLCMAKMSLEGVIVNE